MPDKPDVSLATADDLRTFLSYLNETVDEALVKRKATVRDLMEEGYGDLTIQLTLQGKRFVVATVTIGVKEKL